MVIPYGKQIIDQEDIDEVVKVLRSDIITGGPKVAEFERKFAEYVGSKYAVAVDSGTAALHMCCLAAGIGENDEVLTTPMTFAASANCVLYCNGKPVFVDVNEQGLIDENEIEEKITKKTKAILPVHYGGLPCNMEKIRAIANKHSLIVIEDSCHALGARYKDSRIGDCKYADMSVFSFHPVKHITTGEGGMITTNSGEIYQKLTDLRNHGMIKDHQRLLEKDEGPWYYEIQNLGYNYRITDFQCALGLSQLRKIGKFIARRREIASKYIEKLKNVPGLELIGENSDQFNAYHLFIIKTGGKEKRLELFNHLKTEGILCQIHYIPVYWHPIYQKLGFKKGSCPNAERFYERIISLPIYPSLSNEEQSKVIDSLRKAYKK